MESRKWIVKTTRKELHDIGVCSPTTFDWLLNGQPKEVQRVVDTEKGTMVYLKGHDWCWVWKGMLVPAIGVVSDEDVNKIGPENHIEGGIRAINKACGIDKWAHRKETMLKTVATTEEERNKPAIHFCGTYHCPGDCGEG